MTKIRSRFSRGANSLCGLSLINKRLVVRSSLGSGNEFKVGSVIKTGALKRVEEPYSWVWKFPVSYQSQRSDSRNRKWNQKVMARRRRPRGSASCQGPSSHSISVDSPILPLVSPPASKAGDINAHPPPRNMRATPLQRVNCQPAHAWRWWVLRRQSAALFFLLCLRGSLTRDFEL